MSAGTVTFESTSKLPAKHMLKYCGSSWCAGPSCSRQDARQVSQLQRPMSSLN